MSPCETKKNSYEDMLDNILSIEEEVVVSDLILVEVLQGFRRDKDYKIVQDVLASLTVYELLGENLAIRSAHNFRKLRKKGITIRKTADVIVATYCIENKIQLLFTNKDFIPFVKHLQLSSAFLIVHNDSKRKLFHSSEP